MRNVCAITLFPIDPIISAFYYITPPHTHNMRSHIPRDLYLYIYVWFSSLYKSKMFIALWLGTFCKASSATTTTTTTTTNNATFFLFVSRNYTRKIEVHSTHSVHWCTHRADLFLSVSVKYIAQSSHAKNLLQNVVLYKFIADDEAAWCTTSNRPHQHMFIFILLYFKITNIFYINIHKRDAFIYSLVAIAADYMRCCLDPSRCNITVICIKKIVYFVHVMCVRCNNSKGHSGCMNFDAKSSYNMFKKKKQTYTTLLLGMEKIFYNKNLKINENNK